MPPHPTRSYTKPAIDFPQQLQKMQDRALRYLANISYYRLSGYWSSFLTPGMANFQPGTTLDDILHRYLFDKQLRLLCLEAIKRLEISFRTHGCSRLYPSAKRLTFNLKLL